MKQQAITKKEKQANSFKQLERDYEKVFFKREKARKGEFTFLDKLEDQFWAAVEAKNIGIQTPDQDFQRKPAVYPIGHLMGNPMMA